MQHPKKALENLARSERERLRQRPEEFTTKEWLEAVRVKVTPQMLIASGELTLELVCDKLDREYCEHRKPSQQRTFWDLDGDYRLGDGRRIAKEFSALEQIREHNAIVWGHVKAATRSAEENDEELEKLLPYLMAGMLKRKASEAWERDHPKQ